MARQQYSSGGHDKDGDERNRPYRLVPARPNWDHDRQNDSAEDESVDDAVQSEPVTHGAMLRQALASSRSLSTPDALGVFANAGPVGAAYLGRFSRATMGTTCVYQSERCGKDAKR